ncbi:MAG: hypothetical protein AAGA96_12985 [Verrucomicrobiota bacterium]
MPIKLATLALCLIGCSYSLDPEIPDQDFDRFPDSFYISFPSSFAAGSTEEKVADAIHQFLAENSLGFVGGHGNVISGEHHLDILIHFDRTEKGPPQIVKDLSERQLIPHAHDLQEP